MLPGGSYVPSRPTPPTGEPERRRSDEHTRKIVHMTVSEIFDGVGVDFTTPAGRERFRENLAFLDDARQGTALVKKTFWLGALSAAGAVLYKYGAAIALWASK